MATPAGAAPEPGPLPAATSATAEPFSMVGTVIAAFADAASPTANNAPRINLETVEFSLCCASFWRGGPARGDDRVRDARRGPRITGAAPGGRSHRRRWPTRLPPARFLV
jgi:hypothetical protein